MTQQTLLLLVGLPGSGKSTLAQLFQQQGWVVINQDQLGDRKACEAACWQALSAGQSVVIDRCNHSAMQRLHWLDIARRTRQGGVRILALVLELPAELCTQRAEARGAHATLPAAQAREVIQRFVAEWQPPLRREGFDAVQVARTPEEGAAAAAALLRSASAPTAAPAWAATAGMAMDVAEVEPAVPLSAARVQLNASAPAFQAGMWSAPAPASQPDGWQTRQGMQQGMQPGWGQQAPQQGAQHQQRQRYTSRADAAASWRRGEDSAAAGDATGAAAGPAWSRHSTGPPLDQQQQQQHPSNGMAHRWGQQDERPPHGGEPPSPGSNIVPFPRLRTASRERSPRHQQMHHSQHAAHDRHTPRPHPWQRHRHDEPSGLCLDAHAGAKPILMFDANGCITSHTSMRRSAGIHKPRPGIHHLHRLKEHFHIGIYTSASRKTVDTALQLLEAAAGPGDGPLFDRRLTLHRSHTALAPLAHVEAGGKEWDTVKPLRPYFQKLHRVILVDDDSFKAVAGEEANMLLMPCWRDDDPTDDMVRHLVDVLLQLVDSLGGDPDADVRQFTAQASARLQALAEEAQGGGQACAAAQEVGEDGEQAAAEFEEVEQAAAEAAEMQRAW